ncbi:MAG: hypothetical protein RDU89_03510 [bacterium]|nr:hypothetical protein [bacterium]
MGLGSFFWLIFIAATFLYPAYRQQQLVRRRYSTLARLGKRRGSQVITLIHRQESFNLLGIPITRFINIEDSEQILRAIRLTPGDVPIDVVLHTPGGLVLASEQIARAIRKHPARVTVFVPHYAMSGGTLLALAADELVVDENAVLGPIDPQIGTYPAASILAVTQQKDRNRVSDETLILADIARKAMSQIKDTVYEILVDRLGDDRAREVAGVLTAGHWTHDYPVTRVFLEQLGIPVRLGLPREVYELMELYPQPPQRRPSVQYVPLPRGQDTGLTHLLGREWE